MEIKNDYYEYLLELNNDFIDISSSLLESPEVVTLFLNYVNKRLNEKIKIGGSVIFIADQENCLVVRSWYGFMPPPYKLPEYVPHDEADVEQHFRQTHFSLDEDTIFSSAFKGGKPFLIKTLSDDNRIVQNGDEFFLKCGSYIFIPLKHKDLLFGLVVMSRNAGEEPFSDEDFMQAYDIIRVSMPSMTLLSRFLHYHETNGVKETNKLAIDTQKALLVKQLPEIESVSLGFFHSNGDITWGDYYDAIVTPKNKVHFLMMDVVGRGINSLYILLIVRALIRMSVNFLPDAAGLLTWLNRTLFYENVTDNHYASLSIISYDISTRSAEIATAGINSVFYFDSEAEVILKLSKTSDPLGMIENIKYSNFSRECKPGDIMVICSDGLLESVSSEGEQYGYKRLAYIVKKHSHMDGNIIAKKVNEDVLKFCGASDSRDDRSLLVIKVKE